MNQTDDKFWWLLHYKTSLRTTNEPLSADKVAKLKPIKKEQFATKEEMDEACQKELERRKPRFSGHTR